MFSLGGGSLQIHGIPVETRSSMHPDAGFDASLTGRGRSLPSRRGTGESGVVRGGWEGGFRSVMGRSFID